MQLQCNSPLSSTHNYYLDRRKLAFIPYPKSSSTFGPVATDTRIFISACCCCDIDSLAQNTIYWNFDSQNAAVLIAKADRSLGFITILTYGRSYKPLCGESGLQLYTSPSTSNYKGSSGSTGSTGVPGASGPFGQSGAYGAFGSARSLRAFTFGSQSVVASCPRGPVKLPTVVTSASNGSPVSAQVAMLQDPAYNVIALSPAALPQSYNEPPKGLHLGDDLNDIVEPQPIAASSPRPIINFEDSSGLPDILGLSAAAATDYGPVGESGASGPSGIGTCTYSYTGKRRKRDSELSISEGFGGRTGIASTDVDLTSYLSGEPSSGLVQLSVYRGSSRFHLVFGSDSTSRTSSNLRLRQFSKGCDSPDSVFKVTRRNAYAISPDGLVTKVAAFTIEHVSTRTYVVADVLENAHLNVVSGKAALLLKPISDYDDFLEEPDYRYFARYVTTLDDRSTVATYCSLFFRSYCIWPASTCSLSLMPVDSAVHSPEPNDGDPSPTGIQNFYTSAKRVLKLSVYPKLKMDTITVQYV